MFDRHFHCGRTELTITAKTASRIVASTGALGWLRDGGE
jgi:hypothetical protein